MIRKKPSIRDAAPKTLIILLGVLMLIALKVFMIDGVAVYQNSLRVVAEKRAPSKNAVMIVDDVPARALIIPEHVHKQPRMPKNLAFAGDPPMPEIVAKTEVAFITKPKEYLVEKPVQEAPVIPKKSEKRPSLRIHDGPVRVAVIIDDMGMARGYSADVIDLQAPLTLAFLPYAPDLAKVTAEARASGHELMVHVPMQAMDKGQNIGPVGLREGMSHEDFKHEFEEKILKAFDGYAGINNHMGSRLTKNEEAMSWVMQGIEDKGIYFIDSKTIGSSVAEDMAHHYDIPAASRDVFLDHIESLSAVRASLRRLENVAYNKGYAIAIGHPKPNTIKGLAEWLPTLKSKGIELVPVSAIVMPAQGAHLHSSDDGPQSQSLPPG